MSEKAAAYKYLNEYQKKNYDRITILRKPGEKEKLTRIAKEKGYKTVTQFINACIDEKLESYNTPDLLPEAPTQAPETVPEAPKPKEPEFYPPTPENLQMINFAWLKTNPDYKKDVAKLFGDEVADKLSGMTETEFKQLALLEES